MVRNRPAVPPVGHSKKRMTEWPFLLICYTVTMKLKTIQWNIGGGKLVVSGADPTLLSSYVIDGLDSIIALLQEHQPDIITLQETHSANGHSQPETIAKALGYPNWYNDEYADSHIEAGQRLGQGIVSKFPLSDHSFELFTNPHFKAVWEDGSIAISHDKGRTRCTVKLPDNVDIIVQTFHTVPFRRFKVELESTEAKAVLLDMGSKLKVNEPGLIQADFNVDVQSLHPLFPDLFEVGYEEIVQTQPTTPKGHHYDHILYKGLLLLTSTLVSTVETDHYPIVSEFELSTK